jgi:hypothetical protein
MASAQSLFLAPEIDYKEVSKDAHCVAPGTCTAPKTKFMKRATVIPRDQWTISGGFCGSLSIQSIALTYGAYISQDRVRKQTPYGGGGHGNPKDGYEVLPANIDTTLNNLKLNHSMFDTSLPKP